MNDSSLLVNIITPFSLVLSCNTEIVTMLGELGEFGVLPNHVPMITNLKQGVVRVEDRNSKLRYFVDKAIAKITGNEIVILTEFALNLADIKPELIIEKINSYKTLLTTTVDQAHIDFIKTNLARYENIAAIRLA